MGKLADRLREIARGGTQPMGFAAGAVRSHAPRMLTATLLDVADAQAVSDVVQAGADAALIPVGAATGDEVLKAVATAGQRAMWGGVLAAGGRDEVERLQKARGDFVVLGSDSLGANALLPENIDKLLEVDIAWDDISLRGVEHLPVVAVLFRVLSPERLTIRHLLQCQKVVALTRKPVLAVLPPTVGIESLLLLRDTGIYGVVVPPPTVKDFRAAIRELPTPSQRQERLEATLPAGPQRALPTEPDEEEGEDWP